MTMVWNLCKNLYQRTSLPLDNHSYKNIFDTKFAFNKYCTSNCRKPYCTFAKISFNCAALTASRPSTNRGENAQELRDHNSLYSLTQEVRRIQILVRPQERNEGLITAIPPFTAHHNPQINERMSDVEATAHVLEMRCFISGPRMCQSVTVRRQNFST